MPPAMKKDFEAQNKELIEAILLMRGQKRSGRLSGGGYEDALQHRFAAGNNNNFNFKCDIL